MSSRLRFTHNRPANTDNHYVVGSGIGSKSRFVRSALRRRSSNNAQGKPCCSSKNKIPENKSCLNGMVWKECGSACTRTCSDPDPVCTEQCVPKCECPQGHVLHGGNCVDVNTCNPSLGIEQSEFSCSVYGVSGNYIKDSSNVLTNYCCISSASDPSGCTSGSTGDVCYDTTSDNSGNEKCLVERFGKTDCSSSPVPAADEPIECGLQDCTACPDKGGGGQACSGTDASLVYFVYTTDTTRYATDMGAISTSRPVALSSGGFVPPDGSGQGSDGTSMYLRFEGHNDYDIRPSAEGTTASRKFLSGSSCPSGKSIGQIFQEEADKKLKPTQSTIATFAQNLKCSWTGANIGQGLSVSPDDPTSSLYTFAWKCYKLFSAYAGVGETTSTIGPTGPFSQPRPPASYARFLIEPAKLNDVFNENLTKLFAKYPINAKNPAGTSILGAGHEGKIMLNGGHAIYPLWKLQQYGCLPVASGESTSCQSAYMAGVCSLIRLTDPNTSNNFYFINMGTEINDGNATCWSHETSTCYEIADFINAASTTYFPGGLSGSGSVDVSVYPLTFKSMANVVPPSYGPTWGKQP
jgi:hypothetical protein